MVIDSPKHTREAPVPQGSPEIAVQPNKIGPSTHDDFEGKNLTPYGGLFPVATMLEKLGFQELLEETLTAKRVPRVMSMYQFVLSMVLAVYIGFSRLNHIRFVAKDPMLTRLLKVFELPVQSRFWRFLASLHLSVAQQLLQLARVMRERVWAAANARLFVAAKIWQHAGRTGISYSDQYQERGLFQRLMERLRGIVAGPATFGPVLAIPLVRPPISHPNQSER
jgi:hypothetical protein